MDPIAVQALKDAGFDVTLQKWVPVVPVELSESGKIEELGEVVVVISGDTTVPVALKKISELFTGNVVPPDFSRGPAPGYEMFFLLIERTVAHFCRVTGHVPYDMEFEELYRRLKRRPDETGGAIILSYIRAAVRLYMSLRDVSRAEFDAVATRLARSARTFALSESSTNYAKTISRFVK
jgi:hypothetical protein